MFLLAGTVIDYLQKDMQQIYNRGSCLWAGILKVCVVWETEFSLPFYTIWIFSFAWIFETMYQYLKTI